MSFTTAEYIRDQIVARLGEITPSPWKTIRKQPMPSISSDDLPSLGVFFIRENATPLGDENTGPPKYKADVVLGFSIFALANDAGVIETTVDGSVELILNTLLQGRMNENGAFDYSFMQIKDQNGFDLIDSIPNMQRSYIWTHQAESHLVECRLQVTIRHWPIYPPLTPYNLASIAVAIQPQPETTPTETIIFNIPTT